ncbi:DUF3592 domain-containing protein [Actinoplanes sp. NPDC089786]|uniref:DUF3592 domain-containing protein n=1 Tax=Actinoplanes sp. NPDC089786 TaxID=3155185 RepID=UPI0034484631
MGAIIVGVGVVLLGAAVNMVWQGQGYPDYAEATGTVTEGTTQSLSARFRTYHVSFRTPDNELYEFTERIRGGPAVHAGAEVVVKYDPDEPTRATIPHEPLWTAILMCAGIGVFMLCVGFLAIIHTRRRIRNGAR